MSKAMQGLQTLPWDRKIKLEEMLTKLGKMLDAIQDGVEDMQGGLWPTLSKHGDAVLEVGSKFAVTDSSSSRSHPFFVVFLCIHSHLSL